MSDRIVVVKCPACGIQATVREDKVPALLLRWRKDHARMSERQETTGPAV